MADVRTPWYQSYPKDVPYTIDKPPYQNLGQMFDDVCNKYGKRKAFISFNSAVTFLDVKKAADNLAAYLQHCVQVKKGEKLAVILPNVIQYPVSVFLLYLFLYRKGLDQRHEDLSQVFHPLI